MKRSKCERRKKGINVHSLFLTCKKLTLNLFVFSSLKIVFNLWWEENSESKSNRNFSLNLVDIVRINCDVFELNINSFLPNSSSFHLFYFLFIWIIIILLFYYYFSFTIQSLTVNSLIPQFVPNWINLTVGVCGWVIERVKSDLSSKQHPDTSLGRPKKKQDLNKSVDQV